MGGGRPVRGLPPESEPPACPVPTPSKCAEGLQPCLWEALPVQTPAPFVQPRGLSGLLRWRKSSPCCPVLSCFPRPVAGGPALGRVCLELGSTAHPLAPDFRASSSRGQQRPWALLRISSAIREHLFSFLFLSTSLSSCLCENESYCLFKRAICLRPLEFICWSGFRVHV